jgi:hypothetical protein
MSSLPTQNSTRIFEYSWRFLIALIQVSSVMTCCLLLDIKTTYSTLFIKDGQTLRVLGQHYIYIYRKNDKNNEGNLARGRCTGDRCYQCRFVANVETNHLTFLFHYYLTIGCKLSHESALGDIQSVGIHIKSSGGCSNRNNKRCTSLDQINCNAIRCLKTLKTASKCSMIVTGGTVRQKQFVS